MKSYSTLYVGIDISKLKHDVAIMNLHKQLVHKPFVIEDNLQGYQRLVAKLYRLQGQYHTREFRIGLEATSDYWKNLYYFLKKQSEQFVLAVINPVRTRAFAKTELRRAKTDPVDAKDMALFMVEKNPAASKDRTPIFDAIKDIDTQIYAMRKQQTMSLNKLRIELCKVAPEIEKAIPNLDGKQIVALLAAHPTAEVMAQTSVEELCGVRYGQHQWHLPLGFVHKVKELAQNSVAHKTGAGAGVVVQCLVRRISQGQQEIEILKEQINKLYRQVNINQSILTTIKGIGKETACVLEAYIGEVGRFAHAKKIVAYFGMNPVINKSGKSRRKSYLQKKGSSIVRHKLYMATIGIIRHKKGPIYDYYARLVDDGKPKLVAIGAAMRKLLVYIYVILKTQTPFDIKKNDKSK